MVFATLENTECNHCLIEQSICLNTENALMHRISLLMSLASSEGSAESAHMCRLAKAFAAHISEVWMLN